MEFLRYAKRFFAGTLLSRIAGAIRDVAMAFCFGSSPEVAAFMVAYRFANLFRRLFGEGNLQAGFIPHYEETSALSEKKGAELYRDVSFTLLGVVTLAVLVLEGALFLLSFFVPSSWQEILHLSMKMAPGLIFICQYAMNFALLQAKRSFFTPAFAPVLFNILWIFTAFFSLYFPLGKRMDILAGGVFFAFIFQWGLTAIKVRKTIRNELSWKEWFSFHLFSEGWKKLIGPLTLGAVGIGAVQINGALDAIFSRIADPSGPAFLWYALRVEQLPLSLFGIALSSALLPPLARAMREGNIEQFQALLHRGLFSAALLMIPCTFALFSLGTSGINLLFGRGDFSMEDVFLTAKCLFAYGIGLVPSVFVLLLSSGFYAKKEYKIPSQAAILSVFSNIGLNALLIFGLGMGAVSVAVSTSAASFLNLFILCFHLKKKILVFPNGFGKYVTKVVLASFFSLLVTKGVASYFRFQESRIFVEQCYEFSVLAISFLLSFASIYFCFLRLSEKEIRTQEER